MRAKTRKGHARIAANSSGISEVKGLPHALAAFVRQHDRDRYQTVLFAPAARREALFALYAFNYEVARVRESVREPMLGQIRLQWWREVIDTAYDGGRARRHEVAKPLTAAIRQYGLTRQYFDRLIDTRECDLTDQPFADMAALETYAEGSSGTLMCLACECLGGTDASTSEAARETGIGYALAGLLRAMPVHARTARNFIPAADADRSGILPEDYTGLRATEPIRIVIAAMADRARRHLECNRAGIDRGVRAAFLPRVIARRYLARLERARFDPFAAELAQPDPLQIWRLLAAATTGRL